MKTKPKIELFLTKISQEMSPKRNSDKRIQKKRSGLNEAWDDRWDTAWDDRWDTAWDDRWDGVWNGQNYNEGDRPLKPKRPRIPDIRINELLLRGEDFGGLVFNPLSNKVYKINDEGLEVIISLQKYKTVEEACEKLSIKIEDINDILKFLEQENVIIHKAKKKD